MAALKTPRSTAGETDDMRAGSATGEMGVFAFSDQPELRRLVGLGVEGHYRK